MKFKHLLSAAAIFFFVLMLSGAPSSVSAQLMDIYGMTEQGGANNLGVIFQYSHADSTYTKKFDFDGAAKGSNPYGSLMQATDGYLYGMSYAGGANNNGVLFQYDPVTAGYKKILDFNDSTNGRNPRGALIQSLDGNLYGMTSRGGAYDAGVLFQYDPAGSAYAVKIQFGAWGVTGADDSYGSLLEATDRKLYGLSYGATSNSGVLFQYDPVTSTYTEEMNFTGELTGAYPTGSLIQASDGNLYGTTYRGGTSDGGVLFTYVPSVSVFAKKHDFGSAGVSGEVGITGPTNGMNPTGSLVQTSDGLLYGMTEAGGIYDYGILFQYDPVTYAFTKVFDFDGDTNGKNPYGSLMLSSDGNLYGMTQSGGANRDGVLFRYNPVTATFTKLFDFTGTNGKYPMFSNLIEIAVTAGINEFSANNDIYLSPNPARNKLIVNGYKLSGSAELNIYNVLGQVCGKSEILNRRSQIEVDVSSLPSGIYFVQIVSESRRWSGKFIKE